MRTRIFALLLMLAAVPANAQWVIGGGYYNVSDDEDGIDISMGALVASLGYRFPMEGNFSLTPELRVGIGAGDDSLFGVDVEIDRLIALSLRGEYLFDSGLYLFGAPSYADIEIEASSGGFSVSESGSEFGIGGGVGFRFSDTAMIELSYETFDGTDVVGVEIKFDLNR